MISMSKELARREHMTEITKQLSGFIAKSKNSVHVTEHDAPLFLQSMRDGLLKVGELTVSSQYTLSKTKIEKERLEAVLRLEKFPEFANAHGLTKPTEKDKNAFIVLQPEYQALLEEEAYWDSLTTYLSTVRSTLYTCIDDVKKNIYGKAHFNQMRINS